MSCFNCSSSFNIPTRRLVNQEKSSLCTSLGCLRGGAPFHAKSAVCALAILISFVFLSPNTAYSGCQSGKGYIGPSESKYDGECKDGIPNGKGTIIYPDFSYVGEFKDGKFNGSGVLTTKECTIVGTFKNDQVDGQATYTCINGRKYVGTVKNSDFNGQGTVTFEKGNKEGYKKYVGTFKDDKFHGKGTLTLVGDGHVHSGNFENGKFLGKCDYEGNW